MLLQKKDKVYKDIFNEPNLDNIDPNEVINGSVSMYSMVSSESNNYYPIHLDKTIKWSDNIYAQD